MGDIIRKNITEYLREIIGSNRKIAILVPIFSKYDGAGRVAEQQAKELSRNGYDVTVFTLESDINLPSVKVEVIGAPKNFFLNRIYRTFLFMNLCVIKQLLKIKSFDLIIAHHYPLTYLAHMAKKMYGVKYCFFNHGQPSYGILLKFFSRNFTEKVYNLLMNKLEDWTVKNADFAISNSKFSRERLKARTGMDSVVIYNKVDSERFIAANGQIVREKYCVKYDPLILYVGRIAPSKAIHLLIQAFKFVKKEIPEAKLIIVGKPYYKKYFKRLLKESDESVIFAGYVPDKELPHYYAACDVFATCSLWEGFNLPIVEAQTYGKPVVAFNIGPHPEIIDEKGTLIEPGNINKFAEAFIRQIRRQVSK